MNDSFELEADVRINELLTSALADFVDLKRIRKFIVKINNAANPLLMF